ncbi:acyltransferase family protein [Nibrella saemangeumensis]|uniref:Acyltransferase family protein n=1 Tax=Nibrella saemangeumensis TaxID=1084526 RepID=A0ABP8NH90_9BACT
MTSVISNPPIQALQTTQRYLSLDVLRGMTVAFMIVVNTPGSWETIYAPFRHADWHGFTPTDLVFPTFLFVVGNAMSFSQRKFDRKPNPAFFGAVGKRTLLIFLIGLFLNAFPFVTRSNGELTLIDFSSLRIMGVLQRIALCYLVASLVIRFARVRGALLFSAFALLGYWAAAFALGSGPDPYSLETNASRKLDLLLIQSANLYHGFGLPFEPEGLLSTLPSVVNVLAGYLAGVFIQKGGNTLPTIGRLAIAGLLTIGVALLWHLSFPINKPIWTSSYVLLTVGLDLLLLATLMLLIDVVGARRWTYFFEVFGKNPLFIYMLSGIIIELLILVRVGGTSLSGWLYRNLFTSWLADKNASLAFAVSYMLLLWLIGYWMDKRKLYIRV